MSRQDLILFAFGGIQRYIVESHSTADLGNASRIIAALAKKAAEALRAEDGCILVLPSPSALERAAGPDASPEAPPNTPSRVVALAPEGSGADYARRAAEKVCKEWQGWISALFRDTGTTPETPGFPDIMWCVAPAGAGDYRAQWNLAQTTLAARKRVRTFDFPERTPADPGNSGDQRGRFGPVRARCPHGGTPNRSGRTGLANTRSTRSSRPRCGRSGSGTRIRGSPEGAATEGEEGGGGGPPRPHGVPLHRSGRHRALPREGPGAVERRDGP